MKHRYLTEGQFDYKFEDLSLNDSDNLYNGSALIEYDYDEGDLSVGVYGGFAWDASQLTLEILDTQLEINEKQHAALYKAIEKALRDQYGDHIQSRCENHAEG